MELDNKTPEELATIATNSHADWNAREAAISHPNFPVGTAAQAFLDKFQSLDTRTLVLEHGPISSDTIAQVAEDPKESMVVRFMAFTSLRLAPEAKRQLAERIVNNPDENWAGLRETYSNDKELFKHFVESSDGSLGNEAIELYSRKAFLEAVLNNLDAPEANAFEVYRTLNEAMKTAFASKFRKVLADVIDEAEQKK